MILSIDASTHSTGWALFADKKLIDYGCITSNKKNVFENIFTITRGIDAILKQYPEVKQIYLEEVLPKNEAYDDLGLHHAKPSVFKPLMWLQAGINFIVYIKYPKVKIDYVYPSTWRSKVGISTGRGKRREALKEADCLMAQKLFNLDKFNDDVADAILIGWSQISPIEEKTDFNWGI